jgi:hypothetical protein
MTESQKRRDAFAQAALKGLCATPLFERVISTSTGASEVAMAAMVVADATIAMLDKVSPPKRVREAAK